jgi:ubiquinone/menaquinone biosynthesis C-methylase UbiE
MIGDHDILAIPSSYRNVETVLSFYGLVPGNFEGKIAYDLGCGQNDIGGELSRMGVQTEVMSFDKNPTAVNWIKPTSTQNSRIKADITRLPVADETADIALATFSIPRWARSVQEIEAFYEECQRIVAVNGILGIYPLRVHLAGGAIDSYEQRDVAAKAIKKNLGESPQWTTVNEALLTEDILLMRKVVPNS